MREFGVGKNLGSRQILEVCAGPNGWIRKGREYQVQAAARAKAPK